MSRSVLQPIHAFNPDVEPQLSGFCVLRPNAMEFYLNDSDWGTTAQRKDFKVFVFLADAARVAKMYAGVATTVPRWNGHCLEWSEAKP